MLRQFGAKLGRNVRIRPTALIEMPWNLDLADDVIIGDYAITPLGNGSGDGTLAPPTLPPSLMETLFLSAYQGGPGVAGLPPPDASTLSQLRAFIVRYQVGTVLVVPSGGRPDIVTNYLTAALGRPPAIRGGVEVWPIAPAR